MAFENLLLQMPRRNEAFVSELTASLSAALSGIGEVLRSEVTSSNVNVYLHVAGTLDEACKHVNLVVRDATIIGRSSTGPAAVLWPSTFDPPSLPAGWRFTLDGSDA